MFDDGVFHLFVVVFDVDGYDVDSGANDVDSVCV